MSTPTGAIALRPPRRAGWAIRWPRPSWGGLLRGAGRVLLGVIVAILIAVAFSAVARVQTRTLPAVTGTASVGRVELALRDSGRIDPFASDGRTRELAVWIWYPAIKGPSAATASYLPAAWADSLNNGLVSQDLNAVRTNSLENAHLQGSPPVVVLMPGLGQPVARYSALAEDLASHGYAVVGVNPTESIPVFFPDGHQVPATASGEVDENLATNVPGWYVAAARVTKVWAADAAFVAGALAKSPPAIGALNFSHVAYIGHSLGGAASFEACRQDPHCAAAVDLDGTLWTDVRHVGLTAPSLLVQHADTGACDAFCQPARTDFATVKAAGNDRQFVIAGSTHMNFSDVGLMYGPIYHALGVLGSIDADRMTAITRNLVRTFLDEHILGVPAGAFPATIARYSELHEQ